jgi:hypothetical protein
MPPSATRVLSSHCTGTRRRVTTCVLCDHQICRALRASRRCSMANMTPLPTWSKPSTLSDVEQTSDMSLREWGFTNGAQNGIFGNTGTLPANNTLVATSAGNPPAGSNPSSTPVDNKPTPTPGTPSSTPVDNKPTPTPTPGTPSGGGAVPKSSSP